MTASPRTTDDLGIVVIGRNEGARLVKCLQSLAGAGHRIVYVDSGSTDGSVDAAQTAGAHVVALDMDMPFTAARARNAGLAALGFGDGDHPAYVQFVDGDCEVQPDWLDTAMAYLDAHPDVAIVSGRLRERHPEASVYNMICDVEWNTPVGQATACGGIAMMRADALAQTTLFNPEMIAGEEPELCLRIARKGWKIWRIEAEMALHDADMHRFGQYWKRMRRGGHAFAQWADMYGSTPERMGVAALRRTLIWALAIPLLICLTLLVAGPIALLLALIYLAQIARLALRDGGTADNWRKAALLTIGKFAELLGAAEYHWRKRMGRPAGLIEHK